MSASPRIRPYGHNPFYWEYDGRPLVLLGGSCVDNLFQRAGQTGPQGQTLADELDTLLACGGNYVRCTLSSRDPHNLWPYEKTDDGRYDLERWNEAYWTRLRTFLEETQRRGIIVQVELFDPWDCYRAIDAKRPGWAVHPFNPQNNVNYDAAESGMPEGIDYWPYERSHPFFETVPALSDNERIRTLQEAFVARALAESLPFGNVLYCIDNQSWADPQWSAYWARFLRRRAGETETYLTELWDNWDPTAGHVKQAAVQKADSHPFLERANALVTIEHPGLFQYVELSSHNAQSGRTHYETGLWVRQRIRSSGKARPVNCVKIYGADNPEGDGPATPFGGRQNDGIARFWRNLFAGMASVRFQRAPGGLGLNDTAQQHIRAARVLMAVLDFYHGEPRPDLLRIEAGQESYCFGNPAQAFAVLMVGKGVAVFECESMDCQAVVRRLDITKGRWGDPRMVSSAGHIRLDADTEGPHVFFIEAAE